ncbi:MAG: aminopeptidase [archaeon]
MNKKELFTWLENEGLLGTVTKEYVHFKKVLIDCLNIQKESVLLIGDLGYPTRRVPPLMLGCYALAAKSLNIPCSLAIQYPKLRGENCDEHVIEALLDSGEKNAIVLCTSGKLGKLDAIGRSFRKFIRERKHKFVSTPSLNDLPTHKYSSLIRAIDIDYRNLRKKGKELQNLFDEGKEIHVTTRKGTDLYYGIEGMKSTANVANLKAYSVGGNIPAGEVFVPCRDKQVSGRVVIDASIRIMETTLLIKKPVTIIIEHGEVTEIHGGEEARALESTLRFASETAKFPWGIRRVGEFGVGINSRAKVVGPTIINEKALGTAHIGIGSNAWFGGSIYAITHLDQVFTEPFIKIDGQLINGAVSKYIAL